MPIFKWKGFISLLEDISKQSYVDYQANIWILLTSIMKIYNENEEVWQKTRHNRTNKQTKKTKMNTLKSKMSPRSLMI